MSIPTTNILDTLIETANADARIRLGIIGAPGSGKTMSANTFPNPVFLDRDDKVPPGARRIPFWKQATEDRFVDPQITSRKGPRWSLINFFKFYCKDFSPDTTLIIDSWTFFINRFNQWAQAVAPTYAPYQTKKDEVDPWAIHDDRIALGIDIMDAAKTIPCNLIITMHEQAERDKESRLTGKVKPLMKGQFADQMPAHLTAFFRMHHKEDFKSNSGYCWQVLADKSFNPITPPTFNSKGQAFIPATYESFKKCFNV